MGETAGAMGLIFGFGLAIGAVFVGGCLVGAWIQRDVGFVVKTREAESARRKKMDDAEPAFARHEDPKGVEHPNGPPPPPPSFFRKKRDPMDWRKDLGSGVPDIAAMAARKEAE